MGVMVVMEAPSHSTKGVLDVVGFSMNEKLYALDIALVREVVLHQSATGVPDSPGFVEGVIDLRGEIVPVIDLRKRLNLSITQTPQHIIIVQSKERVIGLVVDRVSEVIHLASKDLQGPEGFKGSGIEKFFYGVGKTRDRLIFILAFDKVVAWTHV